MRKRFLAVVMVLTVTFGMCGTALAVEGNDAAVTKGLQSHGKITYQNGKDAVVIDSQDFYKLEERINLFKQGVSDQLNSMSTYFTTGDGVSVKTDADIRVAHTAPSENHAVDPLSMDFSTILEGIAASQSVPSDVAAYDYPAGTVLYQNADGALTTNGSEKGAKQISVTAATADNLSAGTAAWVDGKLVLGTGEDNKSYSASGYKKGLDEVTAGTVRNSVSISSSNSYTVPRDISNAFLYITYKNHEAVSAPSFRAPDGSAVLCNIVASGYCNHDESQSAFSHLNYNFYYMPKLKAGTVITSPSRCRMTYFIYFST